MSSSCKYLWAKREKHTSTGLRNVAVKSTGPAVIVNILCVDVIYIEVRIENNIVLNESTFRLV